MTSGVREVTAYAPIATDCTGSDQYGLYFRKEWNGRNRTYYPPEYVVLVNPETGKAYRKRVKKFRMDPPNPYTMLVTRHERAVNYFLKHYIQGNCTSALQQQKHARMCFASGVNGGWGSDPFGANDQLKLLGKLHSRIWGSDFNLGVALAEGNKSLKMIAERAQRIARAATYTRKGLYRSAWDTLTNGTLRERRKVDINRKFGSHASAWAEMRWGWSPLYKDMYDGAVWLAHQLSKPTTLRIAVRRNKGYSYDPVNTPNAFTHTDCMWIRQRQLIAYLSEQPRTTVLEAINPASIAWELVPYSFVVDWAVPISSYLALRGLPSQVKGTFVTSDFSWKRGSGTRYVNGDSCPRYYLRSLGVNRTDEIIFERTVSTTLEVPKPEFKGFGSLATWTHAVDSLALMRQKLGKLK